MHIKKIIILLLIIGGLFVGHSLQAKPPIFLYNYNEAIKVSQELNQPMIVIFSADWCSYCVKLKKHISNNLAKFEDTTICIIDIDQDKATAQKYGVSKIPRSIFLNRQGKKTKDITGYFNVDSLGK